MLAPTKTPQMDTGRRSLRLALQSFIPQKLAATAPLSLVVTPVLRPSDLANAENGKLCPAQVAQVYFPNRGYAALHPQAKRCWDLLAAMAHVETQQTMTVTSLADAYRTYDWQVMVFNQRMTKYYNPLTCTTITRTWNGVKYWLKRGYAPCATPGTSNHGWGLAVDAALVVSGKIVGVTSNPWFWGWLEANAAKYGFSWETQSEPWHIRYVAGDNTPQHVLDLEAFFAAQAA